MLVLVYHVQLAQVLMELLAVKLHLYVHHAQQVTILWVELALVLNVWLVLTQQQ